MTEIAKYLAKVKEKAGIKSNLQLAGRLGVSHGAITQIMMGNSTPSDELCVKIARLADVDPETVILVAHKSKASEKTRTYWEHIFNLLPEPKKAAVAASLALFLALPFGALGGPDFSLQNAYRNISYATLPYCFFAVYFLAYLLKSTLPPIFKPRYPALNL